MSLFLLSFSIYFTINGFFLNNIILNKIHIENGVFIFIDQISVIAYSTIVSGFIIMLLKILFSFESNILTLKKEKYIKKTIKKSQYIKKVITIKIIIFIIINYIFLLFFWYYISCFCAVLMNYQMILIINTLITFGVSMVYPFILFLIPGFLRIPALRAKNNKCLYKISRLLALL